MLAAVCPPERFQSDYWLSAIVSAASVRVTGGAGTGVACGPTARYVRMPQDKYRAA
jgi:hypothetical protein